MANSFDIETWLHARSRSKRFVNGELVFSHKNGATSVLVPRHGVAPDDVELARALPDFYDEFMGGSIGDGHIIFASTQKATIRISHDFKIPRRSRMTRILADLGVNGGPGACFFAVEAAWMFAYSARRENQRATVTRYDRDCGDHVVVGGYEAGLVDWWEMVCLDHD